MDLGIESSSWLTSKVLAGGCVTAAGTTYLLNHTLTARQEAGKRRQGQHLYGILLLWNQSCALLMMG